MHISTTRYETECLVKMDILYSVRSGGEGKWTEEGGKGKTRGKRRGGWGVAGGRYPAVFSMKAHSGVNLLEELESSAGCHLFSTLSALSPLPLSPSVNRVIRAALVSALQHHISPSKTKWLDRLSNLLQVYF